MCRLLPGSGFRSPLGEEHQQISALDHRVPVGDDVGAVPLNENDEGVPAEIGSFQLLPSQTAVRAHVELCQLDSVLVPVLLSADDDRVPCLQQSISLGDNGGAVSDHGGNEGAGDGRDVPDPAAAPGVAFPDLQLDKTDAALL